MDILTAVTHRPDCYLSVIVPGTWGKTSASGREMCFPQLQKHDQS
jgi:hypothetical protein